MPIRFFRAASVSIAWTSRRFRVERPGELIGKNCDRILRGFRASTTRCFSLPRGRGRYAASGARADLVDQVCGTVGHRILRRVVVVVERMDDILDLPGSHRTGQTSAGTSSRSDASPGLSSALLLHPRDGRRRRPVPCRTGGRPSQPCSAHQGNRARAGCHMVDDRARWGAVQPPEQVHGSLFSRAAPADDADNVPSGISKGTLSAPGCRRSPCRDF